MSETFNRDFNEKGEKARFIYKPSPLGEHSFQILEFKEEKNDYEPVGDYTLLNKDEDPEITEKKLINLVGILNGHGSLIDFTNLTKERIFFNVITKDTAEDKQQVLFRTHDGSGVSQENALLTLSRTVFDDN